MKLNDVRVLRNIIGDKVDDNDHDEFLERKLPTMSMKKLDLKKMPRKDIYGRNLDTSDPDSFANPDKKKENFDMLMKERGIVYDEHKEVSNPYNPRSIDVSSNKEKEEAYKRDLERRRDIRKLEEQEKDFDVKNKEREIKTRQLEIISGLMKPKQRAPSTMPVTVNGRQVKAFGMPLSIPTREGVQRFYKGFQKASDPRLERLSYSAGGALVGEFGEEASTKALQKSLATRQSYVQYLGQKYSKKGYRVNTEADIMNVATDKERARLKTLSLGVQTSQRNVAATGFLSGGSGRSIIQGTSRQSSNMDANIRAMTKIGNKEVPQSTFVAENLGRSGVNLLLPRQTGTTAPENKWGVIFDQPTSISTDKLTRIIGKGPNPGDNKLDKYMKKFSGNEYKDKVKKYI